MWPWQRVGCSARKSVGQASSHPFLTVLCPLGQLKREWKVSTGEDRYRRGLYTFYFRATPPPALAVFDAPDAFSTCTRRLRSDTPLQALTLLNDQQFYELACVLAARLCREGGPSDDSRIELAFQLCLARLPKAEERRTLQRLLGQQQADEESASDAPTGIDRAQFAAWTTIARVLLNLDETMTRE